MQKNRIFRLKDHFQNLIGNQKRKYFKSPSPKSNSFLKEYDIENILNYVPNSEVTLLLKELLLGKWQNVTSIQLDYILQSFYYLVYCEKEYKVSFVFNK